MTENMESGKAVGTAAAQATEMMIPAATAAETSPLAAEWLDDCMSKFDKNGNQRISKDELNTALANPRGLRENKQEAQFLLDNFKLIQGLSEDEFGFESGISPADVKTVAGILDGKVNAEAVVRGNARATGEFVMAPVCTVAGGILGFESGAAVGAFFGGPPGAFVGAFVGSGSGALVGHKVGHVTGGAAADMAAGWRYQRRDKAVFEKLHDDFKSQAK